MLGCFVAFALFLVGSGNFIEVSEDQLADDARHVVRIENNNV